MSSTITAGDCVLVTITNGRAFDRGTFPAVAREQPFQVAPVSEPDLDDDTAAAWREDDLRTYYGIGR